MSYQKYFKKVKLQNAKLGIATNNNNNTKNDISVLFNKTKNFLPFVYQGPSNRFERYSIYDGMEQDPTIKWSLDVIADFVSQNDEDIFKIDYNQELSSSVTETIQVKLLNWIKKNNWKKRIFNLCREVIKYGDVIYIRDEETGVLNKCNIYDVMGVITNPETNEPTYYLIKNVDLNVPLKMIANARSDFATQKLLNTLNTNFPNVTLNNVGQLNKGSQADGNYLPIKAENIVHISLNVDQILLFPFGLSVLEAVYKPYIQKSMIQECVLLYRLKNSTEKLVFKLPVGNMPYYKQHRMLEKFKNEMSQRRMPSKDTNGLFSTMDVAYSPIPMNEDYYLAVGDTDKNPEITKLATGSNLGEIRDLVYWDNLEIRGLLVPQSWVPYGVDDNSNNRTLPTNKANTLIQEYRFMLYCQRIQHIISTFLDRDFKNDLKEAVPNIDEDSFNLIFFPPSSIAEQSKMDIMATKLQTFMTAAGSPYISKQFALRKFLDLTEDDFNENERLLKLEKQNQLKSANANITLEDTKQIPGLRTIGIDNINDEIINQTEQGLSNVSTPMGQSLGTPGLETQAAGELGGLGDLGGGTPPSTEIGTGTEAGGI